MYVPVCVSSSTIIRVPTDMLHANRWPQGDPLEGMMDGEVVCNGYKVVESPTLVFFNPNSQRPKYIDAPMTVTGITDWVNEEIAKTHALLGRSETDGLTPLGLELANTPVEEFSCDKVRQANQNLRSDVEQFERNQAMLEDKGEFRHRCGCRVNVVVFTTASSANKIRLHVVEELEDKLKELGHDEL